MIKGCAGLAVFLMLATTANASFAPTTSPMPHFRGGGQKVRSLAPNALKSSLIPRLRSNRNAGATVKTQQEITTLMQIAELERQEEGFRRSKAKTAANARVNIGLVAIHRSLIPRLRPKGLSRTGIQQRTAVRTTTKTTTTKTTTTPRKSRRLTRRGSLCGVRSIRGTNAARIRGRGSCGIANPVKVTEVAGIPLTRELVVNCTTAKRLDKWVARSVKPAVGRKGGGLASIQIIGGYACRTRNSKRGAKISEHAKGNAVDIAGFKLKNGTIYSVKRDWRKGKGKSTLRKIHKSACGPFGTVLGPNSDRHHQDHFHLDVARHRSGAYCR
jgi:hypothetical protein